MFTAIAIVTLLLCISLMSTTSFMYPTHLKLLESRLPPTIIPGLRSHPATRKRVSIIRANMVLAPQILFVGSCVAALVTYIAANIDSIREQQKFEIDKAMTQQSKTIQSVQEQQKQAILKAKQQQEESIAKGRKAAEDALKR